MKTNFFILLAIIALLAGSCTSSHKNKDNFVAGVEQPEISLNGIWKFHMDPPEAFLGNDTEFQSWSDIQVPGECQMQGFPIKHDLAYAYKTSFEIPGDYAGKQIQLNFYGVYSYARVWVNGQFIREHYGGFTKWSCNITDVVKPGETAILTLELTDRSDEISYGSGYAKHQIGGILRDVELVALPKQHFTKLFFETDLDANYEDAELKVFYELKLESAATLNIELLDADNKLIEKAEKEANLQSGVISIPVQNPKKWDAEHPNLYTIVTTLSEDGKEIFRSSERIGFREIEVDGNRLLVNGQAVKLRGACRHDIHPTLGRMTTPEYDLKDVLLAKECNMNFIRTSHYPPTEKFLEYCDQYGIYVEDETAVCFVGSHRTVAYRETGASESDPEFTDRYLSQLEEMVQNHRNHPSVIIWSIGNENRFGDNFVKSFEWVKQNDLTRPVIYSYPGPVPDSLKNYEILSMHYPSWRGDLNQYKIVTKGFNSDSMPMLFDEWAHVACYNNYELREDPNVRSFWSQSLDSMWTNLFETEGGLGGAIWCMLDETFMLPEDLEGFNDWWGILDKNIIPATYMGPTVGYGEWGIIDTWRRKKPEFWGTKKAYSPTKIYKKLFDDFQVGEVLVVPVHNRFDHTNFSELRIYWTYGDQSGELKNVNLEPHLKGELSFPANNWNPKEKLNIQFYKNDSSLVDEYNIQLGEKEINLPVCSTGTLNINESENRINISGKSYSLTVNKETGLIEDVKVGDELIIKSGPYLNLKIPGKRVQYSTIEMDDYASEWQLTDINFVESNGIATIATQGSYDDISATFTIQIDEAGVFNIDYEADNLPEEKNIQELGIKFLMGDDFDNLSWERDAFFTAYPEGDIGARIGSVSIANKPNMTYRQEPLHEWGMDSKDFYYFGLDQQLSFTNIVRSLKEHIYSYSLTTPANAKIEVLSGGDQACRFDKIYDANTLIINDQWDYNSLLWGNYFRDIKSESSYSGKVNMKLN